MKKKLLDNPPRPRTKFQRWIRIMWKMLMDLKFNTKMGELFTKDWEAMLDYAIKNT